MEVTRKVNVDLYEIAEPMREHGDPEAAFRKGYQHGLYEAVSYQRAGVTSDALAAFLEGPVRRWREDFKADAAPPTLDSERDQFGDLPPPAADVERDMLRDIEAVARGEELDIPWRRLRTLLDYGFVTITYPVLTQGSQRSLDVTDRGMQFVDRVGRLPN